MAGLCVLKILLWAGIIGLANIPGQNQMGSYTVTTIKFGVKITITNPSAGRYNITTDETGLPGTGERVEIDHSNQSSSHEIKHLKPCTEYEHSVAFIDSAGVETLCNSTGNKIIQTDPMMKDDIKEVNCTPGYVCYRSEWDISSSLSSSPAKLCESDKKTFCIKPGYDDICSDLTTTFTSGICSPFSLTKSIGVDFLNASEIKQEAPTGLPARIDPKLPPSCNSLTVDYTCRGKLSESKELSELEPFTEYSCIGHVKDNDVTIKDTTAINVEIDCDPRVTVTEGRVTNTSIDLSWNTISDNCTDLPKLPKFSYRCSCQSPNKKSNTGRVMGHTQGGGCNIPGLESYTDYTCEVQPMYDNNNVGRSAKVTQNTGTGIPDNMTEPNLKVPEHNVIEVTCAPVKNFKGREKKYIARLYDSSDMIKELKKEVKQECKFKFEDLSYSTRYYVKVTAYNGKFEGKPGIKYVDTLYNAPLAFIGRLSIILIAFLALAVLVYMTYVLKRRKTPPVVNEDMALEDSIYVNVP